MSDNLPITDPIPMIVGEKLPLFVDFGPILADSESIASEEATLYEATTGVAVTGAISNLSHTGQSVTVVVDSANLVPTNTYHLKTFATIGSNKKVGAITPIPCVN